MHTTHASPGPTPHDPAVLEEAFATFTRASAALECTYRSLEQRIERLTEELAEANDEQARQGEENARLCGRLSLLVEALPAGVVVIDGSGVVVQSNSVARTMLGAPLDGRFWSELARAAFAHQDGGTAVLRDGRRLTLSSREIPDRSGRVVLLTDDGEARAVRELLDRHRRLSAMGEMAARLAHQVRTPLAAALLYASQLATPGLSAVDQRRFAARTVARLQDLDRTVQEMLSFARGGRPVSEPLRLGSVLAEALQVVEPELGPRLKLCVECHADDVEVSGSRTALAGALANLVANSAQAVGGAGTVLVEARATDEAWLEITVSDDGPGIPAELRERVFEPFYTTRTGGTGLGLAIVRSVAEAHGGTVEAGESRLGGARVMLRLPVRARVGTGARA